MLAWEDDTLGSTRVYTVDGAGALHSIDEVAPGTLAHAGPDGAHYAVRGASGERELVKLGPCPVARCSIDAR